MDKAFYPMPEESLDDYLWRLGCLKMSGVLDATWTEMANALNDLGLADEMTESGWRKRFKKMLDAAEKNKDMAARESCECNNAAATGDYDGDEELRYRQDVVQARDERAAMNRAIRASARADAIYDLFRETITRYNTPDITPGPEKTSDKQRAIYALLSDIHYGLNFNHRSGVYNAKIAAERVDHYADVIIAEAKAQNIHVCYLSLLGDIISGIIHNTIRIENKENVVEQIVGASEVVSAFIAKLGTYFSEVYVNHVPGNHSRVDFAADSALRREKLDSLIPWYCKSKLENYKNVLFVDNKIDDTIAQFIIFNKNYVAVHGDYDNNLATSAQRIERMTGENIDYMIAGHLHVPEMRLETVGYIRNGSVCGSGDDYTVKNRLFAPPYQVFMICSPSGVDAVHSVKLGGMDNEPLKR